MIDRFISSNSGGIFIACGGTFTGGTLSKIGSNDDGSLKAGLMGNNGAKGTDGVIVFNVSLNVHGKGAGGGSKGGINGTGYGSSNGGTGGVGGQGMALPYGSGGYNPGGAGGIRGAGAGATSIGLVIGRKNKGLTGGTGGTGGSTAWDYSASSVAGGTGGTGGTNILIITKNLIFDLKNISTGGQTGTNGFSGNNGQLINSSTSIGNGGGGGGGQSGGSGRAAIYSINGGI